MSELTVRGYPKMLINPIELIDDENIGQAQEQTSIPPKRMSIAFVDRQQRNRRGRMTRTLQTLLS